MYDVHFVTLNIDLVTYLLTCRWSVIEWTRHAWCRRQDRCAKSSTAPVRRTSRTRQNSNTRSQTTAASRSRLSQTTVSGTRSCDDVILSWPITALRCCTQSFARLLVFNTLLLYFFSNEFMFKGLKSKREPRALRGFGHWGRIMGFSLPTEWKVWRRYRPSTADM